MEGGVRATKVHARCVAAQSHATAMRQCHVAAASLLREVVPNLSSRRKEKQHVDRNNSNYRAGPSLDRCPSVVAVQQRMGLLSQRDRRRYRRNPGGAPFDGTYVARNERAQRALLPAFHSNQDGPSTPRAVSPLSVTTREESHPAAVLAVIA